MPHYPGFDTKASSSSDCDILLIPRDSSKKATAPKGPYTSVVQQFRKEKGAFNGSTKQVEFLRFGGKGNSKNVVLVGTGSLDKADEESYRKCGGYLWAALAGKGCSSASVRADDSALGKKSVRASHLAAFAEGIALAAYEFKKYQQTKKDSGKKLKMVTFVSKDSSLSADLKKRLAQVAAAREAIFVTRDWGNEPSNFGTPEYYASQAQKLARANGLKCTVLSEREIAREKMGLFLSVTRGSKRPAKIVVLEYNPRGKSGRTICLVGKGITFDSGGISLKPGARMEEMKFDMGGAATMMGAILLAAKWKVTNRVVAILGFAENMPSGDATQPGNVIRARSGKTVEIINTDAEGRLILSDMLDYAHKFKPAAILNAATLTGAVGVALGKYCCGLMGNDDQLIESIRDASQVHGERVWQLPQYDEYVDDMKSDVADLRNHANSPLGGTIRAGIFLKQFIRPGMPWAHFDIAYTAWDITHLSYIPKKGATGLYVRTLAQFVRDF